MTNATRARKLRAAIRGAQKLARELRSLGTLTPCIRDTWQVNEALFQVLVTDASRTVASVEEEAAERARLRACGRGA